MTADIERNIQKAAEVYLSSEEQQKIVAALRTMNTFQQMSETDRAESYAVADILLENRVDVHGVIAGLFFTAAEKGYVPANEREITDFGKTVTEIIASMIRLNILEHRKNEVAGAEKEVSGKRRSSLADQQKKRQLDTVRKMFLGMSADLRVIFLKLAYRLHTLRQLNKERTGTFEDTANIAQDTLDIFAPLAGRLGLSHIESKMQDHAFALLHPAASDWIQQKIEERIQDQGNYLERVQDVVITHFSKIGLRAKIYGRTKHPYNFFRKIQTRNDNINDLKVLQSVAHFDTIYDLIAFRILVDTTEECYTALGHIHSLWRPKDDRIKDYIAHPKINGYQSLHTTVFCLDNQLVEFQIRTYAMHEVAEYGAGMHWHYKDAGDSASANSKELVTWTRILAEWQNDLSITPSEKNHVSGDEAHIFVFTPHGEVKELPQGATPLDFAYSLHSGIGSHCTGAKVTTGEDNTRLTTRMVPLEYPLKSGDIVEIITRKTAHPGEDWLRIAYTSSARSKIRKYLKEQYGDIYQETGKAHLDAELRKLHGKESDAFTEEIRKWLANTYAYPSYEKLLAAIGGNALRPHQPASKLLETWPELRTMPIHEERGNISREKEDREQIMGDSDGLLTRLAQCCCPIPPDHILGFISRGKGIVIHQTTCHNLKKYYRTAAERLFPIQWKDVHITSFLVSMIIISSDRAGLLKDITEKVHDLDMNLISLSTKKYAHTGTVTIDTVLETKNIEIIPTLMKNIEQIRGVTSAYRKPSLSGKNSRK